ncbi:hypothetical protein [Actinomadura miaoliensis]|uniref:Uncharacterized protein n=1 Tax=Actinomadura miaoliensis TaxID=430685 RepID=A0ABP7W0E4_9ACTN
MEDSAPPVPGMVISIRSREDVVIVDPERFLATARRAYLELHPEATEATAAEAVADVHDAVWALFERHGRLVESQPFPTVGRGAPLPGVRTLDRPDGLSPAGSIQRIVLNEDRPLQDHGCFLPEDPFALP